MRKICDVKPLLYESSLILSLSSEWIDCFGGKVPTFVAQITDDNKLRIQSHEKIRID